MKRKMFYGAEKMIFQNEKELRRNLTPDELVLWGKLKQCFPGYKFRRQHPVSNYIADFYCHKLKLVIEVDGSIHFDEENQKLDEQRQKELENLGLTILRFTNNQVKNNCEVAINKIDLFVKNINSKSKV
jgi:cyclase